MQESITGTRLVHVPWGIILAMVLMTVAVGGMAGVNATDNPEEIPEIKNRVTAVDDNLRQDLAADGKKWVYPLVEPLGKMIIWASLFGVAIGYQYPWLAPVFLFLGYAVPIGGIIMEAWLTWDRLGRVF